MSVIKFNPSDNADRWDSIPRKTLQDTSLSSVAFQLLMFLLSQPSTWQVSSAHLQKKFNWGKNKVASAVKELKDAGYLEVGQSRNKGRFGNVEYIVHPVRQPCTENSDTVNGVTVDEPLENTDLENTELDKNYNKKSDNENSDDQQSLAKPKPKSTKPTNNQNFDNQFNQFWAAYRIQTIDAKKMGNRLNARKAFVKAMKIIDFKQLMAALERYRKYVISQNGFYYKNASTWLNQRDWETYPPEKTEVQKAKIAKAFDWDEAVKNFKQNGFWAAVGNSPLDPKTCQAPTETLVKYGYWEAVG